MNQFPFPYMTPYSQNNIEQRLANIEAELKKINAKLDKLEKPTNSNSNTYIQKDDNLYML